MNTQRLFLASFFTKDIAKLFENFANQELKGKTITFIPTASKVEKMAFYVNSGRKALEKLGLIVDEVDVSTATQTEIAEKLQKNDFIYVTGGNTFFLLQELKKSGADKRIVEQIKAGKIYIGESAGAVIMSPNIEYVKFLDYTKKAPELENFEALNVVKFYTLPHHTNFPFKKAVEKAIAEYGNVLDLRPISNAQAVLVDDEKVEIVEK
ncbi:MAG: Type 1 glutamine amidotransferase-like domain-containing protein [Paludibacter sp.]|jgi:dipeptidase E|nr:Type 1 glutamine amidotransferase-like domain-containing protein [Paludibacter sp.]